MANNSAPVETSAPSDGSSSDRGGFPWWDRLLGRSPGGEDPLAQDRALLQAIGSLEPGLQRVDDDGLRRRAADLRSRTRDRAPVEMLAVEGFAVAREVCRRTLGLRPYDVQLAGGLAMLRGALAEMQTGEGKTLTAVAPVFLRALAGRGVHVLTFNDYLARRDAGWMGPAYRALGVEVAAVEERMTTRERRAAYRCDVTYLTAKEAGFDYLRDGLCLEPSRQVHRPLHAALVDEADSILIDEARIPLVIAGSAAGDDLALPQLASVAKALEPGTELEVDEHGHNVFLTERGVERAEELLSCGSLFAPENGRLYAALLHALHAEVLLHRDVAYIVRHGAIELVDELTGRVAENRHWPEGLHAAVEAKEGLRRGEDGRILGSITLKSFLGLYPSLCGMTATARVAAEELRETYGLDVRTIPPNRACIRRDHRDRIYTHRQARDRAVVEEIRRVQASGRPVLVGTASVTESERLADALRRSAVPCRVLNAKNDEREAEIVADAGVVDAVTISTNMAGRGTDIRLGGRTEGERDRVVALGGLYVIGTTRHESQRIDLQLRGRAGRQGDPGSSRFFIALDDELLQRYGIDRLIPRRMMPQATDTPIASPVVQREVCRAQRIIEGEGFDIRRRLNDYAEIVEQQRRYLSEWRQSVLENGAGGELLRDRSPHQRQRLLQALGTERLREVERRLTLLAIDRSWGEYLEEMQAIRDEVHLVVLDGRTPLAEFHRIAIAAFERLLGRIEDAVIAAFESLRVTADGVDWDRAGLRGPGATWTYLVQDNVFGSNTFLTLSNRASFGLWAALLLWPVLFAWGLSLHWKRWRSGRRAGRRPKPTDGGSGAAESGPGTPPSTAARRS